MYIKRDIENAILNQLISPDNSIILLSGARQTGKTSIIKNLKTEKEKLIINFWDQEKEITALKEADTFSKFEFYLNTFFNFKPDNSKILIIDEAQASPFLGQFIMQMHSEWNGQKVILLGSILSNLFSKNIPMPTGRTVEFTCRPLNFCEFLRFNNKEHYLDAIDLYSLKIDDKMHDILMQEYKTYMQIGGLPNIVNTFMQKGDLFLVIESLLNNIYRDADRFISNYNFIERGKTIQYGSLMEHCFKSISQHVAFPSTNSTILSTDSPSYRTILSVILEAMQQWNLIYYVHHQTKQQTTKKGYNSKKYIYDTGIMNYLINRLLPVTADNNELFAQLLENSVMQNLVSYTYSTKNIFTYKTNNKTTNELDFVATLQNKIVPIEVKSSAKINNKAITQLMSYLDESKSTKQGLVVYTGIPCKKIINDYEIFFIPPYMLNKFL